MNVHAYLCGVCHLGRVQLEKLAKSDENYVKQIQETKNKNARKIIKRTRARAHGADHCNAQIDSINWHLFKDITVITFNRFATKCPANRNHRILSPSNFNSNELQWQKQMIKNKPKKKNNKNDAKLAFCC